jgi:predicted transcriptional regulator
MKTQSLTSLDVRDQNFETLRATLDERRREVLFALAMHGPCTTRQLAERSGRDILSVRPRITELKDMGLVVMVDPSTINSQPSTPREGIYRTVTQTEWEQFHAAQLNQQTTGQMQLV